MRILTRVLVLVVMFASFGCTRGEPLPGEEVSAEKATEKVADAAVPPEKTCPVGQVSFNLGCICDASNNYISFGAKCLKTCAKTTDCSAVPGDDIGCVPYVKGTSLCMRNLCLKRQRENHPCPGGSFCEPLTGACKAGCQTDHDCGGGLLCKEATCQ